ncbi:hypothetical protein [Deinococcus arcticus]|uniref:Uncharacterized protein n=1 Tax=Deinococcus arcticus TaxID=2136176 RepID=A0A2T3W9J9_9DEIO|nr:hypothetical protein [Deinococcus arcticus]PTA68590.1 hypothetical protein C8263_07300 [Deinococcus arcticus]
MDFNSIFGQVVPMYTQVNFWVTLAVTLVVWYAAAVGFAHVLFGGGARTPVNSAKQGMLLALLLVLTALAAGTYYLFMPADLIYMVTVSVTFLLLSLILSALFSKMGAEK